MSQPGESVQVGPILASQTTAGTHIACGNVMWPSNLKAPQSTTSTEKALASRLYVDKGSTGTNGDRPGLARPRRHAGPAKAEQMIEEEDMNKTIRRLTMPIIGTLVASAAVLASPSPALAGGCKWGPCGEAQNNSPWTIRTTEVLGTAGPDWCDVWNGNGGKADSPWHTTCEQKTLAPGSHRGGGSVDVDAVTFADHDYVVKVRGKLVGWKTKGVWTRLHNNEHVVCFKNSNGDPMCEVYFSIA